MCPDELQSLIAKGIVRQVPPEEFGNKLLWTDGHVKHWFNTRGHKVKEDFSPSMRDKHYAHGHGEPKLRSYGNRRCRILMGVTFYGKRPSFKAKNGKPYPGIAHHLINDLSNYCADNLLCWLTREEHGIADKRRQALEAVVPNGNLYLIPYERLRELQDPRTMSDEDFQRELEAIRDEHYHYDPRPLNERMKDEPFRDFDPFIERDDS